jgi:hypothetical protein
MGAYSDTIPLRGGNLGAYSDTIPVFDKIYKLFILPIEKCGISFYNAHVKIYSRI